MNDSEPPNRTIKSAVRTFDILETLRDLESATFTELSERLDVSDSTLYDYLQTLVHLGYVVNDDGTYRLALQFFDFGIRARDQFQVHEKAREPLETVAQESGAAVWLMVEEAGKAVYLAREMGEQSIETHERLGKHEYMHCLASGKAMLAFSTDEHVDDVVERHGLPERTHESITTRAELEAELETIRERGYAMNEHEAAEGVSAVAAPIVADGDVFGAIAIAEPVARMRNDAHRERMIELVTTATNETELRLAYQ
ncbi:IclR family transcriptional regulator [Halobellus limi]|uniref:IclR family transcriptional regulator n=1 Tax=Halobellus limi TaxID=699433 RepID=A0A1H6BG54_9EURY|nr:IclR family transcriptional regulator [Halobellus limi]QCC49020.1 IclR family transcriptional regulator [Halobellus limi]SEG59574.1 transcriptional regulator, IclR family [Halobellus limi]